MALTYPDYNNLRYVQSTPIDVYWAGWRSTTTDLQHAGWELSAYEDYTRDSIHLGIKNKEYDIYGYGKAFYSYANMHRSGLNFNDIVFDNMKMGRDIHMFEHPSIIRGMQAIDAYPELSMDKISKLSDLKVFRPMPIIEQQLIVPEYDVDSLLNMILEKQQSSRIERITNEIRARPAQQIHAQIVSLRA